MRPVVRKVTGRHTHAEADKVVAISVIADYHNKTAISLTLKAKVDVTKKKIGTCTIRRQMFESTTHVYTKGSTVTHAYTHIHTHTHKHTQTNVLQRIQNTHTDTNTSATTFPRTYKHALTHMKKTQTNAFIHTQTHEHTHTYGKKLYLKKYTEN